MSRTLVTMLYQPVTSRGQPTGACPNDSTAVCWQLPPPVLDTRPGARGGGCEDGDVVDAAVDAAACRRRPRANQKVFVVVKSFRRESPICSDYPKVAKTPNVPL